MRAPPEAYGTYHRTADGARLEIKSGTLAAKTIELPATGKITPAGVSVSYTSTENDGRAVFIRA